MRQMNIWEVRELCIKKDYFTLGSVKQYEMMFDMLNDEAFTIREIAVVIWTCSENADLDEITDELTDLVTYMN